MTEPKPTSGDSEKNDRPFRTREAAALRTTRRTESRIDLDDDDHQRLIRWQHHELN